MDVDNTWKARIMLLVRNIYAAFYATEQPQSRDRKTHANQRPHAMVLDRDMDTILDATDRLFISSTGNAGEIVLQTKILAAASDTLVKSLKEEADYQTDSENQKKILAAAKVIEDTIIKVVKAAKDCVSNPHDSVCQAVLQKASDDLSSATNAAANNALKRKLIWRLEYAVKQAAAVFFQCISVAQETSQYIQNPRSHEDLLESCKGVQSTIMDVDKPSSQINLISSCKKMIQAGNKMVSSSETSVPTMTEPSAALQLSNSTKQMTNALAKLQSSLLKAQESAGSLELENTLDLIRSQDDELLAFRESAERLELKPFPGETIENSALQLEGISKLMDSSMAKLFTAVSQANESDTRIAASFTGSVIKTLTKAIHGVAATCTDRDVQTKTIDSARDVMDKLALLFQVSQRAMNNPSSPDIQKRLTQVVKTVSTALNSCVNCLPGLKDVEDAIRNITDASQVLNAKDFPHSNSEIHSNFTSVAENLSFAATNVVTSSKGSPAHLANSSKKFGRAVNELLNYCVDFFGGTEDTDVRSSVVASLKTVSMVSCNLLAAAKSVAANPGVADARNLLDSEAQNVMHSISNLNNVCSSAAPGNKECDNAIRSIQSMRLLFDNPIESINDFSYSDCLESVTVKSKILGEAMTGVVIHALKNNHENFGESVNDVSDAVCGLVEAAAQAAYLVGVWDPSSVAGRYGLVDVAQFNRSNQAFQSACQQLRNSASEQQQILSAATVIAKHTLALCKSCSISSSKTYNPVAKCHFVQSAEDVVNATDNLMKEIKTHDQEPNGSNHQNTFSTIKSLIKAVKNFTTYANSPEIASIPGNISQEALVAQEPIKSEGKSIIDYSCSMISSAKCIAVSPKDPSIWKQLANHSKNVSDSIEKLVASIKDMAPGQKECDAAIEKLSVCIWELDLTSLSIIRQNLIPVNDYNLKVYQEQMESSASEIIDRIDLVTNAAKGETENLGHLVAQMTSFFDHLVQSAIGSATKMVNSKQQKALLDQMKTVAERTLQFIYASKETGRNPKVTHDIDKSVDGLKNALQDLLHILEAAATEAGFVTGLLDLLIKSIVKVNRIIKSIVENLGTAFVDLTSGAGFFQGKPHDSDSYNTRTITDMVSFVQSVSTVVHIIDDLDTTINVATVGCLHAVNENEIFPYYIENILKTTKVLIEDTKKLVTASSQEQLTAASEITVITIVQLAESVKYAATSLGSNNSRVQVLLINAVKDVAIDLRDLILATKDALGKAIGDPAIIYLRGSVKVMVTNFTSFLETIKSVYDESTIEAVEQKKTKKQAS